MDCGYDGKQYWISIHALREESDMSDSDGKGLSMDFNPRPPRGERRQ